MSQHLVLIRHGHRDIFDSPREDSSLSEKGLSQAEDLKERLSKVSIPDLILFCSPKRRCQQTLQPGSESLSIELTKIDLLDEQAPSESDEKLQNRILKFLKEWLRSEQNWVACTHGDWIPLAIHLLTGKTFPTGFASWTHFQLKMKSELSVSSFPTSSSTELIEVCASQKLENTLLSKDKVIGKI